MESTSKGDESSLISGRINEKAELQDLYQRYYNYIQNVRSQRENQSERNSAGQIESLRATYEQQINDLHSQLDVINREKNEVEASRSKYDSMSSEYETRCLSLNEQILKQRDDITQLQIQLSDKNVELQEAQSQLTGPRSGLEAAKLEIEDLKQKLGEMERRCLNEERGKFDFQHQLTDFHARSNHELAMYRQEIGDLQQRLERSRLLILEMEEASRRTNNGDLEKVIRKSREASEMELRRFMEEAENKHSLDIAQLKMQMDTDSQNLNDLLSENNKLRTDLNSITNEYHINLSKLASLESSLKVSQNMLDTERSSMQTQIKKMEQKHQETKDLLLIKLQELSTAQDANIPLKAEIDFLRRLIEEEEKRLKNNRNITTKKSLMNFLENNKSNTAFSNGHAQKNETNKFNHSSSNYTPSFKPQFSSYTPKTNRPASVPIATRGFVRASPGSKGSKLFEAPLATSNYIETKQNDRVESPMSRTSSILELKSLQGSELGDFSPRSQHSVDSPGVSVLPPRPNNPTPPKILPRRPASANNARYIPGDAGQGRDYFDSMFNDLRKDTMYTKVTKTDTGVDSAKVTTSTKDDLLNCTASATGDLKVFEIDEGGRFVCVHNSSATRAIEIGGHLLQQNVAGHPVAMFRFPPRTKIEPGNTATVWCAGAIEGIHDPPSHYVWKQLDKWGTGPECTTILCKPNGQAVAWMTSAPRISRVAQAYQHEPEERSLDIDKQIKQMQKSGNERLDEYNEESYNYGRVTVPVPSSYTSIPRLDEPQENQPPTALKREKKPQFSVTSVQILPTRTGSAPLRRYTSPPAPLHHSSQNVPFHQMLATNGDAEIIDLTTQRSARSKYGFDFMTHPPKVINHSGTVMER